MKNLFVTILIFVCAEISFAQTFSFAPHDTVMIFAPLSDIAFKAPIVNISSSPVSVFVVRIGNNIPGNWYSSLCFGQNCFAFFIDSVASTTDFGEQPIPPGDTLDFSLHIFSDSIKGNASVTLMVGNLNNPNEFVTQTFSVKEQPTGVDERNLSVNEFQLYQNYPNPFNPSTVISYQLSASGNVVLKLFDVLGNEVATLIDNEWKEVGYHNYQLSPDASGFNYQLPSGVYFYQLQSGEFSATKKFVLMK